MFTLFAGLIIAMAQVFRHLLPFCFAATLCVTGTEREQLLETALALKSQSAALHAAPTPVQPTSRSEAVIQQRTPDQPIRISSAASAVLPTFGFSAPLLIVAILGFAKYSSCSDGVLAPYSSRDPPAA